VHPLIDEREKLKKLRANVKPENSEDGMAYRIKVKTLMLVSSV
jgi:hypothetical protein